MTECRGAEKNGYGRAHLDPGEEDDDGHRTEALQSAGQPYPVVARSEKLVTTIHEISSPARGLNEWSSGAVFKMNAKKVEFDGVYNNDFRLIVKYWLLCQSLSTPLSIKVLALLF